MPDSKTASKTKDMKIFNTERRSFFSYPKIKAV
jgi:hypothetical protein